MNRSPEFTRNLGILAIVVGLGMAGIGLKEGQDVLDHLKNQQRNLPPPPTTANLNQAQERLSQLEQEIIAWLQQGKPPNEFPGSSEDQSEDQKAYGILVQERERESLEQELSRGSFPASEKGIPSLSIFVTGIASVVWGLGNLFKKNQV